MPVSQCVRCGNKPEKNEKYCKSCGAPLVNRCTYDGGLTGEPCTKENPADAAFCVACGQPTMFNRTGLLQTGYTSVSPGEEWEEFHHFTYRFFEP
ncbi:hypothetical protein DUZ99_03100 [Xylanibacillus composti]|uniref:DZANK-type domain-containing protein n=1 Tax=Xylanibacillus composti TaxID=1572762 RepID=A0A8J4M1H8_9BACL|nr:hypothetical protein [Xylanibacillus composti]MDT9723986.1 hypothetical protein [Xylanibacillus composti]GIQ67867.1 hypothetical protein XYCOK13_06910 [Xylanibacillus composti]